jgi:hypothetical protein
VQPELPEGLYPRGIISRGGDRDRGRGEWERGGRRMMC